MGPGNPINDLKDIPNLDCADQILEIDSGRDEKGDFCYRIPKFKESLPHGQKGKHGPLPPSSVWFIDSHGHSTLHHRLADSYTHVFFAVWSRRDLFIRHPSRHWCPNATDLKWFSWREQQKVPIEYDFGFFGSKGGLDRAGKLKEACEKLRLKYRVCQINRSTRHMWPHTAEAMAGCRYLFNHGQKHDGPNQRVLESMAMKRPLLTDVDPKDGMKKLFVEGHHYIGYESYTYDNLEEKLTYMMDNKEKMAEIAANAYDEVRREHLIQNRVDQMLKVWSENDWT